MANNFLKFVFMLAFLSLVANLVFGILPYVDIGYGSDPTTLGGSFYDSRLTDEFSNSLNATVLPSGTVGSSDAIDTFRGTSDSINFGSINAIQQTFDKFIFGIVYFITDTTGPWMGATLTSIIKNVLKAFILAIYTLAFIGLWLGRNMD